MRHKEFNQILCLFGGGCDSQSVLNHSCSFVSAEGQVLQLPRMKSSGNLKLEVKQGQEVVTWGTVRPPIPW